MRMNSFVVQSTPWKQHYLSYSCMAVKFACWIKIASKPICTSSFNYHPWQVIGANYLKVEFNDIMMLRSESDPNFQVDTCSLKLQCHEMPHLFSNIYKTAVPPLFPPTESLMIRFGILFYFYPKDICSEWNWIYQSRLFSETLLRGKENEICRGFYHFILLIILMGNPKN